MSPSLKLYFIQAEDHDLLVQATGPGHADALWREYFGLEPDDDGPDRVFVVAADLERPKALPWHDAGGCVQVAGSLPA